MTKQLTDSDIPQTERVIYFLLLVLLFAGCLTLTILIEVEDAKWFFIRIMGPVLFVLWLASRTLTNRLQFRWDPIAVFAVASLIIQCVSLLHTTNMMVSLEAISKQFALICVYFLVANICITGRDRDGILWAITLIGFIISLYGIAQHFGYDFFPWEEHIEVPVSRGVSFVGHATFAASVLIMCIPIALGAGSSRTLFVLRIIPRFMALVMLYHLSFTGARVATVALFTCGILVMILIIIDKARSEITPQDYEVAPRLHLKAVVTLMVLIMLGSLFIYRAWSIKDSDIFGVRQASVAQRIFSWETANRMFWDNPVTGVGTGNYEIVSPLYWNDVEANRFAHYQRQMAQPHNEFMETAAEQGLPGVAALLALMISGLAGSLYIWHHDRNIKGKRIGLALFAAILAACFDSTFIFNLQQPASALLFWTCLGLVSEGTARIRRGTTLDADKIIEEFPAG